MFGKTSALQEEKASIALSGHFSIPSSAINFHFWHQISNSPTIKIIFNTLFKNLNQCKSSWYLVINKIHNLYLPKIVSPCSLFGSIEENLFDTFNTLS